MKFYTGVMPEIKKCSPPNHFTGLPQFVKITFLQVYPRIFYSYIDYLLNNFNKYP
jgi:hypothetical protein